jgi:hypothetical protein
MRIDVANIGEVLEILDEARTADHVGLHDS